MNKRALRTGAKSKSTDASKSRKRASKMSGLYRRSETKVKERPVLKKEISEADPRKLLHELQVHQVELEMQKSALLEAQEMMEQSLERYTDLYDFAPVAYFTLDHTGSILQVNLAGAQLVSIDRVNLISRSFARCLVPSMRPRFNTFLKTAFTCAERQTGEFDLIGPKAMATSVSIDAQCSPDRAQCRLVATDITERKKAEQTRRQLEVLAASNRKLELEIVHRQDVERSLLKSERLHRKLLIESKRLQTELRRLTHVIFETLEEERRRLSRELHDQITQTLVSISLQLISLSTDKKIKPNMLLQAILRTQKLVAQSVEIIHDFAKDLRPTELDHLGLIPALSSLVSKFHAGTHIQTRLIALPDVEKFNPERRIVVYRIVQSALSNVEKHSEAKNVLIEIRKEARCIFLTIADDGKSFDERLLRNAKADRRLGLLGMRERVEMVGGSFEIQSKPGQGTTVQARIPFSGRIGPAPKKPKKVRLSSRY